MVALILLHLGAASVVVAQRYLTTFGIVSEIKSARFGRGIFAADLTGDGKVDVISYGGRQLHISIQNELPQSWKSTNLYADYPVARATAAKCNQDRYNDIVLLTDSIPQLEVVLGNQRGKFALAWKSPVDGIFDNVVCADIDNDRKTDILLFGKKELGITVYEGKGNGTFRKDTVLLREYSYSNVVVSDINGDGINDIIAANWISNSLLVFTGFGKMRFSQPVQIPFSSEPGLFCTAFVNGDNSKDMIVGLPEESVYHVLYGDGLGTFEDHQAVRFSGILSRIEAADINGDGKNDICLLCDDEKSLRVDLNDGKGNLADHVVFAAGQQPVDFALIRQQGMCHAAILNSGRDNIRILYGAKFAPPLRQEVSYATGVQPYSVLAVDVNGDGREDIVTANLGSRDISLYLNEGRGGFTGAIPFGDSIVAGALTPVPGIDSSLTLLSTRPDSGDISIIKIHPANFASQSVTLPTTEPADIVYARTDPASHLLHFVALERERSGRSASLVEYDQIAASRFVEKDITPPSRATMMSAAMADLDGDNIPDLVSTSYDAKGHREDLSYAIGIAGRAFRQATVVRTFDCSEAVPTTLWLVDVNRDGLTDVLLNLRQPDDELMIFWGSKDSVVDRSPYILSQPIRIERRGHLRVYDVNGDGAPDFVCQNNVRKTIQLYLHRRDGSFSPSARLARSEGSGGFALTDVDDDKIPELVVADRNRGLLQIISLEER